MKVKHVLMIAAVLLAMFVAPVVADDKQVIISTDAAESYEFSIPQDLKFNPATAGATLTDTVGVVVHIIDPEAAVSITVDSANGWYLNHEKTDTGYRLQYDMKVDGETVEDEGLVFSTAESAEQEVVFTLKESATKSGEYADTLTFTAQMVASESKERVVYSAEELQKAVDEDIATIYLGADITVDDITGDVTVTQKPYVEITINGNGKTFDGAITVDGKSARYETAALTIKNVNFEADSISKDAFINLGAKGDDSKRYTNHVTVMDCTFADTDGGESIAAIKSYTGGDWNLKVIDCTVKDGMHSFLQLANVEKGLEVVNCNVYSKNGINLNNGPSILMSECTFDVTGYAVRVGVDGADGGSEKTFTITNSNLKSSCDESNDAVIVIRQNAKYSTFDLTGTNLNGDPVFLGEGDATITGGNINKIASQDDLNEAKSTVATGGSIDIGAGEFTLGSFNPSGVSGVTIEGVSPEESIITGGTGTALTEKIADGTTFKNLKFTGGNALRYCYAPSEGSVVTFENCVFDGSTYAVHFDSGKGSLVFKNCVFSGFNALGASLEMVTFEDCTFVGNGKSSYNGANLWGSATMINCEFTFDGTSTYEWIDCMGVGKTYVFTDCTVNGDAYTPDNFESYKDFIDSRNDVTVKINGVDCVLNFP